MKITFNKISTKNLATLAERIISSSKNGQYKVVENHELLLAVENEYKPYDVVYSKLTYSGKGPEIAEADETRDKAFSSLKLFLKSYKDLPSMPDVIEAQALYDVFEQFGLDIDRMNYAEESAQMKKLIEALEKPENLARLTTLRLDTSFGKLKDAQERFEALYAIQAEANADLRTLPSASAIRRRLERALRDYIGLLTAMRNVPGWEMIYADIHELVKAATIAYKNDPKKNA